MNTCEPTNHQHQLEPLSQTALALAARLAGLIERTMNLYETELTQAEEAHAATTTPESPVPTPKSPTRIPNPDSRIPNPAAPRNTIGHLKALIQSMESLLRSARLARALEETAPKASDTSGPWLTPEMIHAINNIPLTPEEAREIRKYYDDLDAEAEAKKLSSQLCDSAPLPLCADTSRITGPWDPPTPAPEIPPRAPP